MNARGLIPAFVATGMAALLWGACRCALDEGALYLCERDGTCRPGFACVEGWCHPRSEDGGGDAGAIDAGRDSGVLDGGRADAGMDGGAQDSGQSDAGLQDAGVRDAGEPDAGGPDSGTPGALDRSFGDGGVVLTSIGSVGGEIAYAVLIQPDGKILVGGQADRDFALARYDGDGTPDVSFGSAGTVNTTVGLQSAVLALALDQDGGIVASGWSFNGSNNDFATARYAPDGRLDTSFGANGRVLTQFDNDYDSASAVFVLPGGNILVAGDATVDGGTRSFALAQYTTTGSLDNAFGSGGKTVAAVPFAVTGQARAAARQADGRVVVVGSRAVVSMGPTDVVVARFLATGGIDPSFGSNGFAFAQAGAGKSSEALGVTIQPDGKIVASGSISSGTYDLAVFRFQADGSRDNSFGTQGIVSLPVGAMGFAIGMAVLVQPDWKTVVAGTAMVASPDDWDMAALRFLPGGGIDPTFGSSGVALVSLGPTRDQARAIARQPDGKVVLAGAAMSFSTPLQIAVARLWP